MHATATRSTILRWSLFIVVSAWVCLASPGTEAAFPAESVPAPAVHGLTCEDAAARTVYDNYLAYLASDPVRYASLLDTVRQLETSEMHFRLAVVPNGTDGIEGWVTTDGRTVLVRVTHKGGPHGEVASLNSRLAHELEHARQVDSGEIAFTRDSATGRWGPGAASYDIGDDVKAWEAQVTAAIESDYWRRAQGTGLMIPSVLRLFADAPTRARRARVLLANGYRDVRPVVNANVGFTEKAKLEPGTVVYPTMKENFFGRVYGARPGDEIVAAIPIDRVDADEAVNGVDGRR